MPIAPEASTAKAIVIRSLSYVVIVGGLTLALALGARWLVSADPAAPPVASTPRLPPRIADSIERKREPLPPPPPVVAEKPFVAQPVMQQATVSLHPPRAAIRELRASKPGRKRPPEPAQSLDASPQPPAPVAERAVVTTARSDVPY